MSIKNIIISGFAVAAFGTVAMAQTGQPNQSPQGPMGRPGAGKMEKGPRGEGRPERRMMGRGMGMRRGGMNFERLNLTDAQKQRIQAIQASAKNSREANKTQFEEFGNLMRLKREGLLTSEQGTRLNALQVQMQTQMKANMDKMQADIMAVLTPDQKTLLEQARMQRPGGDRGRMRGGQRPGQPPMPNGAGAPPPPTNN
jgi:Spy/CpxP family protein refolding chaperone